MEVLAAEDTCWTVTAYDKRQAEEQAESDRILEDDDYEKDEDPPADPREWDGCGGKIIELKPGTVYAGVGIAYDEEDNAVYQNLWAAAVWFSAKRIARGGVIVTEDVTRATAYSRWPDRTYVYDSHKFETKKLDDFFAAIPDLHVDDQATKGITTQNGDPALYVTRLGAIADRLSQGDDEAMNDLRRTLREGFFLTDTTENFFELLGGKDTYRYRDNDSPKAFDRAMTRLQGFGPEQASLALAMRKVAYAHLLAEAQGQLEYPEYSSSWADARGYLPQLRVVMPTYEAKIAAFEKRVAAGYKRTKAKEDAEQAELDAQLEDYYSNCIDGDGDGVCHES